MVENQKKGMMTMKFKNKKTNQVIEVLTPNLIMDYKTNKNYEVIDDSKSKQEKDNSKNK